MKITHNEEQFGGQNNPNEISPQHKMFVRELLSMTGCASLEELRSKNLTTSLVVENAPDPGRSIDPLERATNKVIEDEGERCQLCHQPIQYKYFLRVDGIALDQFIGSDCARKVFHLNETGNVEAVNTSKRKRDFLDAALDLLGDFNYSENAHDAKKKVTKQAVVSSMLTWLKLYFEENPEKVPEEIVSAVTNIREVGYYPNKVIAEKIVEFYNKVRTYDPLYKLDQQELGDLDSHPHKGMLSKIVTVRRTNEELDRIRKILARGYARNWNRDMKKYDKRIDEAPQKAEDWIKDLSTKKEDLTDDEKISLLKKEKGQFVTDVEKRLEEEERRERWRAGEEKLRRLIETGTIKAFPLRGAAIIRNNPHLIKKFNDIFGTQVDGKKIYFETPRTTGKSEYHYSAFASRNRPSSFSVAESAIGNFGIDTGHAREMRNNTWWNFHVYEPVILNEDKIYIPEENDELTSIEEFLGGTEWKDDNSGQ